jgi:uncharacterized protein YdeI (YjbR/CyaY-like superfamily)
MARKDPRVDAYIAESGAFARPILTHLRALVHKTVPEVEEEIKWGKPHFAYKGMFCGVAAFKAHCAFIFWNEEAVFGETPTNSEARGQFGRLTSIDDLPSDRELVRHLKKAIAAKDAGATTLPRKRTAPRPALPVPPFLTAALKKNAKANAVFKAFNPSQQRDYVEWLTEAKTEATRDKRLAQALEWIAEGKTRHWKYETAAKAK